MDVLKVIGALLVAAPFTAILGAIWHFEGFYAVVFVVGGTLIIMGSIVGGITLLTLN